MLREARGLVGVVMGLPPVRKGRGVEARFYRHGGGPAFC